MRKVRKFAIDVASDHFKDDFYLKAITISILRFEKGI